MSEQHIPKGAPGWVHWLMGPSAGKQEGGWLGFDEGHAAGER